MNRTLKIGYLPILCTSPLLYAHLNDLFTQYGVEVELVRSSSWSNLRDQMIIGYLDAAHMPFPMVLGANLGLYGTAQDWELLTMQSVNGMALTLAQKFRGITSPSELKGTIIGVPHKISSYYYLLCQFLAEHNIDPLEDVQIREIAPRLLPYYLEKGTIDAYYAPEPYNQYAVHNGHGFIHHLSRDYWHGFPCCGLVINRAQFENQPDLRNHLRDAMIEASYQLHVAENGEKIRFAEGICIEEILDTADTIPVIQSIIGDFPDGTGKFLDKPDRIDFLPNLEPSYGFWVLAQMQRWGQLSRATDYQEVIGKAFATDTQSAIDSSLFSTLTRKQRRILPEIDMNDLQGYVKGLPFSKVRYLDQKQNELPEDITKHITQIIQHIREVSASLHQEELPRTNNGPLGDLESVLSDLIRNVQFSRDLAVEQRTHLENNVQLRTQELEAAYMRSNLIRSELKDSKDKLNIILEHIPYYVVELKRGGKISYINRTSNHHNYMPEDMVGESLFEYIRPDCQEIHRNMLNQAYASGNTYEFEGKEVFDKQSDSWYHYIYTPLQDLEGNIRSLLMLGLDITAEKERARLLTQAKKHAELANEAKSQFLANMSHEIRTPMNGIIGLAELLKAESLPPKSQEYVNMIHTSASSLLVIINDILDLSKIEAGKLSLEEVEFELDELVFSMLAPFQVIARQKGIQLKCHVRSGVPTFLTGDPTRLRQILTNLLSNALKFTERGEIVFTIRLCGLDNDQANLCFSVRDTGPGIPEDKIASIFESFNQGDVSTTRKYGGTGLGLTISQKLIEMMGGSGLQVNSTPEQGSEFSFELPFSVAEEPTVHVRTAPDVPTIDSKGATEFADEKMPPLRILVAEDNMVNQTLIRALLEPAGHSVIIVDNGLRALEAYEEGDFDCILMDGNMPVMDGLEATRRIRALEQESDRHIPIYALTASALKTDRELFLNAGMDEYITKPIDTSKLRKVLQKVANHAVGTDTLTFATESTSQSDTDAPSMTHIDREAFANRFKLLPKSTVTEIINIYEEESIEVIDEIKMDLQKGRMLELQHGVHRLKGMVSNFCADTLSAHLQQLESTAMDGQQDKVTGIWNTVEPELAQLSKELHALAHEYE